MSRSTPNPLAPRPRVRRPAGSVGAPDTDPRAQLLERAGITAERQAEAVSKAFTKQVDLLEATTTKFFAHDGAVVDTREVSVPEVQLKAAESLHRLTGANAPPTSRTVEVVHRLEWPEWYRTEDEPLVIDVVAEAV